MHNNIGSIGGLVRRLRLRHGDTQEALASKVGVNQVTVSAIERGDTQVPDAAFIAGVARAYGVSADYLLGLPPVVGAGVAEGLEEALDRARQAVAELERLITVLAGDQEILIGPRLHRRADPSRPAQRRRLRGSGPGPRDAVLTSTEVAPADAVLELP